MSLSDLEIKLNNLISRRSAYFERVQSIYNSAKNLVDDVSIELFLSKVESLDSIRNDYLSTLESINAIETRLKPNHQPSHQAWLAFEDLYCYIKRQITKLNLSHDSKPNISASEPIKSSRPKLPALQIPEFSGDVTVWNLFHSTFLSAVHNNDSLTDLEKLHYLLGKLTGQARSVCAGLTPCASNYSIIYETLVNRYEDLRFQATTYLDNIFNLKPMSSTTAESLESFVDKFASSVAALKNLKLDNLAEFVFLYLALKRLDPDIVRLFDMEYRGSVIPSFDSLVTFLREQIKILHRTPFVKLHQNKSERVVPRITKQTHTYSSTTQCTRANVNNNNMVKQFCSLCNSSVPHDNLYKCAAFCNMSPYDRYLFVRGHSYCLNCLSSKHKIANCNSGINCKVCNRKHHSMLHFVSNTGRPYAQNGRDRSLTAPAAAPLAPLAPAAPPAPLSPYAPPRLTDAPRASHYNSQIANTSNATAADIALCSTQLVNKTTHNTILLATARVIVYDVYGRECLVRCLLDNASQSNFITNSTCEKLGLCNRRKTNLLVKGIGGTNKAVDTLVNIKIHSRFNRNISYELDALVVDRITERLPNMTVDRCKLSDFDVLPLADDTYSCPGDIDMLLGASLFHHLLLTNKIEGQLGSPYAWETTLGYIVVGPAPATFCNNTVTTCCAIVSNSLDNLIKRFWDLEEIYVPPIKSPEDNACEKYYSSTTKRDPISGRYIVALPFCKDPSTLGDSYQLAKKRFLCLERKLIASPAFKLAYDDVILDYIDKGYISPAPTSACEDKSLSYVIPHHGVVREDKTTTKLRIVLDASAKTTSSISLNDILFCGENLQGNLFDIIINFRLFAVALSADVRQMFLCIEVREEDRKFQRLLYRFSPTDPIVTYQFNRVCFGVKSSPFHALRTIKQLAEDVGDSFPHARDVLELGLYMDDVVHSVDSEEEGVKLSTEMIAFFKTAGFDLVKWTSNSQIVLNSIPISHRLAALKEFDETDTHKVLGLSWSPRTDLFRIQINPPNEQCTKRAILSCVARLWDLMGFLGPVVLYAKLLVKQLWLLKCDWDDAPPASIVKLWSQYRSELHLLNKISFPRHVDITRDSVVTVVGFADASEKAYGAVVYLHVSNNGINSVHLMCSKSRVSPTKTVSLARLELCAALVLAKLIRIVCDTCSKRLTISNVIAFSDSTVTLCWIYSSPHRWDTFVGNRVSQLQSYLAPDSFRHVSGIDNPADCLSRGLTPAQIIDHPLWFHGPPWLSSSPSEWKIAEFNPTSISNPPEEKTQALLVSEIEPSLILLKLADQFSSWCKLLRCIVYICRFVRLLPHRKYITAFDLRFAEYKLIRQLQKFHFSHEIKAMQSGKHCSIAFRRLKPFLENGIVLVGGRLQNSDLSYQKQHPIVLPRNGHVMNLLIDYFHKIHCHAGPDLLMSILRENYWIFSARNIIRSRIHKCNRCFRLRPKQVFPEMSNHPACRVTPSVKAFIHTGTDFAGPIKVTPHRGRGIRARKAYICLFVCLTTRAIHIELASDLSAACFLLAFKRFLSRRGPVTHLYSDNGTNFIGARGYLDELHKLLVSKYFNSEFSHVLAENRIEWHLNPPAAPHFGGNWESNIKSLKSHLYKVVGDQILTFEELSTVLTQVEAVMNSRPLCRTLTSDPSEPLALTPAHFLTSTPLKYLPAPTLGGNEIDLNQRHSLLTKLVQSFWSRWRRSYLHTLTTRQKWNTPSNPIAVGNVVIIIIDNAPPLHWPLGIIEEIFPAKDDIIRIARVRTSSGSYLRPVVRLCPLPNQ
ncbi:uncharacterized protein LOC131849000 [Achroia grisella]|uniref:uncharacterized protein LOC131849000 n=1 Tax=Achroia grisella TaxID=688607 RepID=UPI0027D33D39|nr:uncharacterized protein LOC131849000 [Achroia grisella]